MSRRTTGIGLLDRAADFTERPAVVGNRQLTYGELRAKAENGAAVLLAELGLQNDLEERRIAFLVTPSEDYLVAQWSIWCAGGIAVPLCVSHPVPELEYVLRDSDVSLLLYSPDLAKMATAAAEVAGVGALAVESLERPTESAISSGPTFAAERRAMIIYTSGTTGRPKGVVSTHGNLSAQIEALVEAWGWSQDDRILNVLPLHHLHGIVNVTCCALWSGACLEIASGFDAEAVWQRFEEGELTLFMAVPTIYSRLLRSWREVDSETRRRRSAGTSRMRLMVSGSAALPVSVLEEWEQVSGHRLLERYGMSETGMILSNPLAGERVPGSVGQPVPGMEVRFKDGGEEGDADDGFERRGELEVRGPAVFHEYWRRARETEEAFVDGWFQTGDMAVLLDGCYRLLGRTSVDILKSGGYKISALEIEEVLRDHPAIAEVAVVGVDDVEWGQRVAAAVVLAPGHELELDELRAWGKELMAPYKVPTLLKTMPALPRNALGKVTKPQVIELF